MEAAQLGCSAPRLLPHRSRWVHRSRMHLAATAPARLAPAGQLGITIPQSLLLQADRVFQ